MSHNTKMNLAAILGLAFGAGAIRAPNGKGWMVRDWNALRVKGEPTEADTLRIKAAEDKRTARAGKRASLRAPEHTGG